MQKRKLGQGLEVSAEGLGCMGMSDFYGVRDEDAAIKTIHHALDRGINGHPDYVRKAHAVHPITAVQSEWSLWTRDVENNGVLATVRELGIGFVAYSPLG